MRLVFKVESVSRIRQVIRFSEYGGPNLDSLTAQDLPKLKRQFLEWLLNEDWLSKIEILDELGAVKMSYRLSSDSFQDLPLTKGEESWLERHMS